MTTLTDPNGGLHQFAFDTLGRLTNDQDPAGGSRTLSRTQQANGFTVTDTTGQGVATTDQIVNLSTGGQQHIDTDTAGLQTVQVRHPDGSQTITRPDGTVEQIVLGPDPRFGMAAPVTTSLTITTPGGLTSTLTETRTATLSDPNNPLSLTSETDTVTLDGQSDTTVFDAATSTVTETSPAGRVVTSVLDAKGRVIETDLPGQTAVQFTYDGKGHLITVTQGNRTETFNYDATNKLTGVTDPLGEAGSFIHDAAGRVTAQTLPNGQQIQFSFDASGNLLAVTPPGRPAYDFTYTSTNLLQTSATPGITPTQYVYNLDKQLTQVTLADGSTIQVGYDSTGMPVSLTDAQGTTTAAYDAQTGNVKSLTAPSGVVLTYGYDGSLPTDATWSGPVAGSVHDSFNNNFQLATQSVDGANSVTFQYDSDGLVTAAGDLMLNRTAQTGQLTGTSLGNVADSLSYDMFGAATGYQATVNGSAVYAVQDTTDSLGRVTQRTETIGGVTHTYAFTYDANGWLTGVTKDGTTVAAYSYDANGNRHSLTGPNSTVNGAYDSQDRLLQYGTLNYTYTPGGQLATKTDTAMGQTTRFTYDALGNLLSVVQPDGTRIDYLVDGQGQRIGKKVNGTLVQGFLYANGRVVAELDGVGNVVSRFVYGTNTITPDYMIQAGVEYRILTDERGSVRLVVNAATGALMQRMDYDEFGNVTNDSNPGFQPFAFAGGVYDLATGLVRFGARDYDAQTGRWSAKDPIGLNGGQTNLYVYARNDPVNFRDPSGLLILYNDAASAEAYRALLANPTIGSLIMELDQSPSIIDISLSTVDFPWTHTHTDLGPNFYSIEVDLSQAQQATNKILGMCVDTTPADIIAHELGHVYADLHGYDSAVDDALSLVFENASRETHNGGSRPVHDTPSKLDPLLSVQIVL
jgi:RHS repeat-associated protein